MNVVNWAGCASELRDSFTENGTVQLEFVDLCGATRTLYLVRI